VGSFNRAAPTSDEIQKKNEQHKYDKTIDFSIEIKQDSYNRSKEVIVLPPSFNYWNKI
jgi:predicted Holliday junction resolvase-like endonuclease